jgi:hypothetical protein
MSPSGQKPINASSSGALHVAQSGSALETYALKDGTAADAYNSTNKLEIADFASYWTVYVENNPALISFEVGDTGVWLDDIRVSEGYSVYNINTHSVRIKNRNAGSNAVFQLIGWS